MHLASSHTSLSLQDYWMHAANTACWPAMNVLTVTKALMHGAFAAYLPGLSIMINAKCRCWTPCRAEDYPGAMAAYTRALEHAPSDIDTAVLYAKRAAVYMSTVKWKAAEGDCARAVEHDRFSIDANVRATSCDLVLKRNFVGVVGRIMHVMSHVCRWKELLCSGTLGQAAYGMTSRLPRG